MMDYGKYKYEQSVRAREARKKQTRTVIKEVQFRPKIGGNDFDIKARRVMRFLDEGDKVKVTMRFRGREVTHPEIGMRLLDKLVEAVGGSGEVETPPRLDGRQMTMVIGPSKRQRTVEPNSAEEPRVEQAADADDGSTDLEPVGGGVEEDTGGGDGASDEAADQVAE